MSLTTAPPERNNQSPASAPQQPAEQQPAARPVGPTPAVVTPNYFVAPKTPWGERINFRLLLVGAVVLLLVGFPFFVWIREALSGGIIRHGDYSDVNLKAMSSFEMDQVSGRVTDIPAKFRALDGTRVALVGEMWQPAQAGDGSLRYFQLVYSKTKCCFSGPPLAQHFVDSHVAPGRDAYYYPDMVRVWGTLRIQFRKEAGVIKSVYAVDVDKVEPL